MNPRAGRRPADVDRIKRAFAENGITADFEVVPDVARMRERAVATAASRTPLAVAGGDGTVSVVIDAILSNPIEHPPLIGVVPTGTGCDLLRTFGIVPTIEEAVPHLRGDATYLIDAGRLTGSFGVRHFINVAQTGVGAAAAESANSLSRRLGPLRYPLAFAARLPRFPRANVTLVAGRTYESSALAVIFANAQFFAGGWNVAPKALLVDGLLDVQIIDLKKRQAPALVPKLIKGVHLSHRSVTRRSLDAFDVSTSPDWPVEADGDFLGYGPIRVETVPGAVRLKI